MKFVLGIAIAGMLVLFYLHLRKKLKEITDLAYKMGKEDGKNDV